MTPALPSLIARLEAAEGPDRELDAAICSALRIAMPNAPDWITKWNGDYAPHPRGPAGQVAVMHTDGKPGVHWKSPPLTASIDSVVALISERLPGATWQTGSSRGPSFGAVITKADAAVRDFFDGEAKTAPCALLIAALKAIEAQQP